MKELNEWVVFAPVESDLSKLDESDARHVENIAQLLNTPNLTALENDAAIDLSQIKEAQRNLHQIVEPLKKEMQAHPGKYKILAIQFPIFSTTLPSSTMVLFGKLNQQHVSEEKMRIELLYLVGQDKTAEVEAWIALHRRLDANPLKTPFTLVHFVNAKGGARFNFLLAAFCSGCQDLNCYTNSKKSLNSVLDQFLAEKKPNFNFSPRMDENGVARSDYERDALLLEALYSENPTSLEACKQSMKRGEFGRFLVQKHMQGWDSRWEPLTGELEQRLSEQAAHDPGDKTLEWIKTMDRTLFMVVTIRDGFHPSDRVRTLVVSQPWLSKAEVDRAMRIAKCPVK